MAFVSGSADLGEKSAQEAGREPPARLRSSLAVAPTRTRSKRAWLQGCVLGLLGLTCLMMLLLGEAFGGGVLSRLLGALSLAFVSALAYLSRRSEANVPGALHPAPGASDLVSAAELSRLEESCRRLSELDAAKTKFFSNVSHELRTPLTLAMGPLEALLCDEALPKSIRRELSVVQRSQYRLRDLVNTLLDFSKLDAGYEQLSVAEMDIVPRLRALFELFAQHGRQRQMAVQLELPSRPIEVFVDAEKFERLVVNLLSNAFKYTPDGGSVSLVVDEAFGHVRMRVSDTGVGISPENLPAVFDRFRRTEGASQMAVDGTGIGLAMATEYAEMHHGTLAVSSATGLGSTFRLLLRRGSAHFADGEVSFRPEPASGVVLRPSLISVALADRESEPCEQDNTPPRSVLPAATMASLPVDEALQAVDADFEQNALVLVVDDNSSMRRFLRSVLSDEFRVVTANDGAEALELAERLRPELVVSDVMMPVMNGEQLCQAIREGTGLLASTPVMLLTAKGAQESMEFALSVGANDYLHKPFHARELLLRARNLARVHRQRLALASAHATLIERQRRIREDLELARHFQEQTFARIRFPAGLCAAVHYEPAMEVGGDLYDIITLPDGRVRVILGDITDHGVQAALRGAFVLSAVDRIREQAASPSAFLVSLNDLLTEDAGLDIQLEALCFDLQTMPDGSLRMTYAQAGGNLGLRLLCEGRLRRPETAQGPHLGLAPGMSYDERSMLLADVRYIFACTDGIEEQTNTEGLAFDEGDLNSALRDASQQPGPQEVVASLLDRYRGFVGTQAPRDDLTLVVVSAEPSDDPAGSALD